MTAKLVATSPHGNRCKQLNSIPTEVDYCVFVGDSITITCRVSAPNIITMIYNGVSSSSSYSFNPVLPTANGNYLCNGTNDCGTSTDMLNVRVYGKKLGDRETGYNTERNNKKCINAVTEYTYKEMSLSSSL